MPIVCALVPAYKVAVARHADPRLNGIPLIVADKLDRGAHAIALDAAAFEFGARAGMTLVQAGACAREAAIVVDDPARGRALWERALDALDAASPLVEDVADGTALLEMRGIEGEGTRWLGSVRDAFASDEALRGLPLRVALAPNGFVAQAAARVGDGTVVASGEERAFVAPLPLHTLELEQAVVERLHLLGVHTLGDLAALPHGPFVRRFGPCSARWHARACGVDDAPIVPRPRRLRIDRSLYGEGTAEREEQVLFALRALVGRVADDVAFSGKRCGFLRLQLECEDGETLAIPTLLAQPTAQATTMFELLRARLEGLTLRAPVVGLSLAAERLEEGGAPLSLFAGRDPDPEVVGIALARLEAALGPERALRASVVPGHRFETRVAYAPFTAAGLTRAPHANAAEPPPKPLPEGTLVYRVLQPRPVDVRIAGGVPRAVDGRTICDVAGPWRVDEAWWGEALDAAGKPHASDAYDVSFADGGLVRIVCERGRWYLAGTYD